MRRCRYRTTSTTTCGKHHDDDDKRLGEQQDAAFGDLFSRLSMPAPRSVEIVTQSASGIVFAMLKVRRHAVSPSTVGAHPAMEFGATHELLGSLTLTLSLSRPSATDHAWL